MPAPDAAVGPQCSAHLPTFGRICLLNLHHDGDWHLDVGGRWICTLDGSLVTPQGVKRPLEYTAGPSSISVGDEKPKNARKVKRLRRQLRKVEAAKEWQREALVRAGVERESLQDQLDDTRNQLEARDNDVHALRQELTKAQEKPSPNALLDLAMERDDAREELGKSRTAYDALVRQTMKHGETIANMRSQITDLVAVGRPISQVRLERAIAAARQAAMTNQSQRRRIDELEAASASLADELLTVRGLIDRANRRPILTPPETGRRQEELITMLRAILLTVAATEDHNLVKVPRSALDRAMDYDLHVWENPVAGRFELTLTTARPAPMPPVGRILNLDTAVTPDK